MVAKVGEFQQSKQDCRLTMYILWADDLRGSVYTPSAQCCVEEAVEDLSTG